MIVASNLLDIGFPRLAGHNASLSCLIRRVNLDGSSPEDLVDAGFGAILDVGLAVDAANGKIYWADMGNDKIARQTWTALRWRTL